MRSAVAQPRCVWPPIHSTAVHPSLLSRAIENNVALYASVLGGHDIAWRRETAYATTDAAPPSFYGNLVTILPAVEPVLARVATLAARAPKPDWGLKDSFACLDPHVLAGQGMKLLFEAVWYGAAAGGAGGAAETGLRFRPVVAPAELASWEAAWQRTSPAPGERVFPDGLLAAGTGLRFLGAYAGQVLVGGVLANDSDGAIGVSNVFAADSTSDAAFLRDAVRAVAALAADRPVVGYGPAADVEALARFGVHPLGPLRVYVAGAPPEGRPGDDVPERK